nr:poly(A)-specific ribonuclease PARN-like [Leptinotarsa decemlineata]
MEITNSNFHSVLPDVEKAIENCSFLSIDCELTGLYSVRNINSFDTPCDYYEKMRNNSKDFLVIQYGLSTFRYSEEDQNFKQQTYNFYIFRRPLNRNIPDQRFLCQSSSIDFLISEGMDFNKLFREGISYLNENEKSKYEANLEEAHKKKSETIQSQKDGNDDNIPIPDNARPFMTDVAEQIELFLQGDQTELQLPKCNAFLRKLVYQMKKEKFDKKIFLETRQIEKDRILVVKRAMSLEEERENHEKNYESQLKELDDFIGFTKVLKAIVKSEKLVIGHNLLLDFLHSINQFLVPLPDDYEEFKEMAHNLFPRVIDTKYMSSSAPFDDLISSSVLNQVLDRVSEEPFQIPDIVIEDGGQGYKVSDKKEHEAGYDAFITGVSFLSMWKYLGVRNNLKDSEIFGNMDLLEPYLNKIFLMFLTDNQYLHLAGEDLRVSRDHVFHLTFPKDWKLNNILQLFSPFGNVHVSWIDDTSAYVGLAKRDQAALAFKTLSQSDSYSIMLYDRRRAILSGISTPLCSPKIGKKKKIIRKSS